MYIFIPDVFFVPVHYCEDVLKLKKIVILQECNYDSNFINKTTKRQRPVIGVAFSDLGARFVRDKEAMEQYAKSKNVTLKIENANFDIDKQVSQVDDLRKCY